MPEVPQANALYDPILARYFIPMISLSIPRLAIFLAACSADSSQIGFPFGLLRYKDQGRHLQF